ncbi:MAG: iron reductase [Alphaproteobacteria bacterium]|nr:iron reductase [Alphaproteobacteria bacterium]
MREHERLIVGGLVSLLLILTPGFLIHVDPRFAGSLAGGALGIAAAVMMIATIAYPLFKRIEWLRRRASMRVVLQVHVIAGVLGPLLAMLHSGHKFESPIGIAMIVLILVLVISGFVGRYYMNQLSTELRGDQAALGRLQAAYAGLQDMSTTGSAAGASPTELAGAIVDIEQAIVAQQALKRAFAIWMDIHIVATLALFLLLGLHVWSAVYFGLRWLG